MTEPAEPHITAEVPVDPDDGLARRSWVKVWTLTLLGSAAVVIIGGAFVLTSGKASASDLDRHKDEETAKVEKLERRYERIERKIDAVMMAFGVPQPKMPPPVRVDEKVEP